MWYRRIEPRTKWLDGYAKPFLISLTKIESADLIKHFSFCERPSLIMSVCVIPLVSRLQHARPLVAGNGSSGQLLANPPVGKLFRVCYPSLPSNGIHNGGKIIDY